MPTYPARIIPGEDGLVLVTFPDVPEAVVCGEGEQAALERAPDILDVVLSGYAAEARPIPEPSDICGAPMVSTHRFGRVIDPIW